jgi:Leucine-rich repeat (LRR) protein
VQFADVLRQDLFHYYPDTYAELQATPSLPYGVRTQTDNLSIAALIADGSEPDMDDLSKKHHSGVVCLDRITRATLDRLQGLPNLQRIGFTDEKTSVLPREITTLPSLRLLELNLNRKFKKLHKNLGLAGGLEALLLTNLHNLTDISILASLPKLAHIAFYNTIKLEDYTPLQQLPQLRHLELLSLDLELAAPVVGTLTDLTTLDVKSSAYFERTFAVLISLIESLPSLTALGLGSADLSLGTLPPLDHIEQLNLDGVETYPSGLFAQARSLRSLTMQFYESDALPQDLGKLASLEALDLSFAKTLHNDTDFTPLAELVNLQHLDLSQLKVLTRLPDAVGTLSTLRQINLAGHRLQEISALRGLPELRCANLQGVKDEAHLVDVVMSLPALERVEVAHSIDIRKLADHPSLKLILGTKPKPETVADRFDLRHSAAFLRR